MISCKVERAEQRLLQALELFLSSFLCLENEVHYLHEPSHSPLSSKSVQSFLPLNNVLQFRSLLFSQLSGVKCFSLVCMVLLTTLQVQKVCFCSVMYCELNSFQFPSFAEMQIEYKGHDCYEDNMCSATLSRTSQILSLVAKASHSSIKRLHLSNY